MFGLALGLGLGLGLPSAEVHRPVDVRDVTGDQPPLTRGGLPCRLGVKVSVRVRVSVSVSVRVRVRVRV